MFNWKVTGAAIFLIPATAPTVLLLLLAAYRLVGVVAGKFRLEVVSTSGLIHGLRIIGVLLMVLSVLVALYALIGSLTGVGSDRAAYAIVSGILGGGSPIGLVVFEASRVLERDLLIEPDGT